MEERNGWQMQAIAQATAVAAQAVPREFTLFLRIVSDQDQD
jgi:hypothetical protein